MLTMHHTSYGKPQVGGDMNKITIGKYCSISDTVLFDGGIQHNHQFVTTYPLWRLGAAENRIGMCKGDIVVGNDVWIGDGAVIGASAIVTKDVPPYEIWGGVPAKRLKDRFTQEQVVGLLSIQWWNWKQGEIYRLAGMLLSENIDELIDYGLTHLEELMAEW